MSDISGIIYSYNHIRVILREIFKARFAKPYIVDYRQSPYYQGIFRLNCYHKLNKYNLKYDIETANILNLDTGEPLLIFSFDGSVKGSTDMKFFLLLIFESL